jgi:endonuclease IV
MNRQDTFNALREMLNEALNESNVEKMVEEAIRRSGGEITEDFAEGTKVGVEVAKKSVLVLMTLVEVMGDK